MDKIVSIKIDGEPTNVIIVPEHWNHGQSGFENADVYTVMFAENEAVIGHFAFSEDKTDWQSKSYLSQEEEDEIVTYIKSQSPLTAL